MTDDGKPLDAETVYRGDQATQISRYLLPNFAALVGTLTTVIVLLLIQRAQNRNLLQGKVDEVIR